jgi:hypothetical protein
MSTTGIGFPPQPVSLGAGVARAEQGDQTQRQEPCTPALNPSQDWIPDYPPEGGEAEEEPDDNQDSTEYPEDPQDEQRD